MRVLRKGEDVRVYDMAVGTFVGQGDLICDRDLAFFSCLATCPEVHIEGKQEQLKGAYLSSRCTVSGSWSQRRGSRSPVHLADPVSKRRKG